jgi:tRNA G26 N,N-dimethylase Trm1
MSLLFEYFLQNDQHTPALKKATITVLSVAKNFQVEVLVEISNNMKKSVKDQKSSIFCQYCAKQFKFNYLVIRDEKGCRDRPG